MHDAMLPRVANGPRGSARPTGTIGIDCERRPQHVAGSSLLRLGAIKRATVVCAVFTIHLVTSGIADANGGVDAAKAAPAIGATAAPAFFSPNGDSRKDASVLTVTLGEAAVVDVRVLDPDGTVVRSLVEAQVLEGRFRVVWDGRRADGTRTRDGVYRFVVEARDLAGNASSAAATVRVDTRAPRLAWPSRARILGASPLSASLTLDDASAPLAGRFQLVNAYGRAVRTWTRRPLVRGGGRFSVARRMRVRLPGVYRVRGIVEDAAGNRSSPRLSAPYRVDRAVRTRVVARVENVGRHVALTFDDCFSRSSWDSILRTLARTRVTAAFFCPGNLVRNSRGLAARTVRAGHTIGSHGWDHALLSATSYGNVRRRLERDRNVWWNWLSAGTPYFRPPYGAYNATALSAAGAVGYRYTVLWDVDTRDWTNPGVGSIVSRAVNPARAGSIILLHVKPQTAAALPHIIRRLRTRGLAPVGLEELLHRRGARPSPAGWSARAARPVMQRR
jgi:peptidoglycan/xylan/chitin deacetylase (PgdA/CDA1 family)